FDLTIPSPITGLKCAHCQDEDSPKRRDCRKSGAVKQVPVYAEVFLLNPRSILRPLRLLIKFGPHLMQTLVRKIENSAILIILLIDFNCI
ncbi:hypothetical protein KAR04_01435, partial [Candidatus Calescamantes bacterium]|nr:hypothetical protein [Candidatus Calescamantes bacterium]